MEAKIKKWVNSLTLRIPKALADEINLTNNSKVKLIIVSVKEPSYAWENGLGSTAAMMKQLSSAIRTIFVNTSFRDILENLPYDNKPAYCNC